MSLSFGFTGNIDNVYTFIQNIVNFTVDICIYSQNAQKYHRMYLNSRNSLRSPGFYQFSGRQQAFWLQNEEYATPPIEIQQNHQTYRNSKIEKSKLKDPGLNNVNYAVQEPVRIFLERLHPQRKTNRCSNSAFLNGKNIDKSIKNVNDGSPIRKSTQQTLNQSSTDEVLPTRNATEISLKQSNLIAISYVEKETDLSQRYFDFLTFVLSIIDKVYIVTTTLIVLLSF